MLHLKHLFTDESVRELLFNVCLNVSSPFELNEVISQVTFPLLQTQIQPFIPTLFYQNGTHVCRLCVLHQLEDWKLIVDRE